MMKGRGRFLIVIILTLIAGGTVSWHSYEPPLENARFFDFPMVIDGWKGRDVPMAGYVYQSLETKYFFLRDYYSDRYPEPVNLSIVWFDDRNIAFHAPEACLGGVGVNILGKDTVMMNINGSRHPVTRLIVDFNGMRQMVLYYFDVEGKITTSQSAIRYSVLARNLALKRTGAAFIRLMAGLDNENAEAGTMKKMADFLNAIQAELPQYIYSEYASGR